MIQTLRRNWRAVVPLALLLLLLVLPAPQGLPIHAWRFLALFVSVICGIILEPLPGGAVGFIGVAVACLLAPYVLYGPNDLAAPGFSASQGGLRWALSGFSNGTVWLIFAAFMFSLGYEKSGLGRRIALLLVRHMGRKTWMLGYAVMLADLALAPVTPSNTARSGGTIYPVLANLPALYDSKPNDASARKIGSYIMWVAISSTCVTSTLFMTALAPNLLAIEIVRKTAHLSIGWLNWFYCAAPLGIVLLLATPLLAYVLYKPEVTHGNEVPAWAADALRKMGRIKRSEITLMALVLCALGAWVFATDFIEPTTTAMLVIAAMLLTSVITWSDFIKNHAAWNTLAWFATLIAMADGLTRVGIIGWFTHSIGAHLAGISPTLVLLLLLTVFYFSHYAFASVTAHAAAMLPAMLGLGMATPDMPMAEFSMLLCMSLGIMGIITPYGTGPSPVYYGSGYLPSSDYWRLGAIFGLISFVGFMLIAVPWVLVAGPALLR